MSASASNSASIPATGASSANGANSAAGTSSANGAAAPTVDDITAILRGVIDPELGSDIVDLGMVKGVELTPDGTATITIALTTMGCPLRAQIKQDTMQRVSSLEGIASVEIDWTVLTSEEKAATMAQARKRIAENPPDTAISLTTRVLLVASGKGGVGKSTVTVNLAGALAKAGYRVGVLDADIWGFSVPRMLGVEGRLEGDLLADDPQQSQTKIRPLEKPCEPGVLKVVSMGLLVDNEETALMWRGLILNRAVRHFLEDVSWGELDYLLVDLPPGTGDVQMGVAKMLPQADMLVVTTPAQAAQKVAVRAGNMGRKNYLRIAGVIENMSGSTAPDGSFHSVFGQGGGQALAEGLNVPLLGQIPLAEAIAAAGDAGQPVTLAGEADSAGGPDLAGESAGELAQDAASAQQAFAALAKRIAEEVAPPLNMSACTARLLETDPEGGVLVELTSSKS